MAKCLAGCGAVVGEGQKCAECAAAAVAAWKVEHEARQREAERAASTEANRRAELARMSDADYAAAVAAAPPRTIEAPKRKRRRKGIA